MFDVRSNVFVALCIETIVCNCTLRVARVCVWVHRACRWPCGSIHRGKCTKYTSSSIASHRNMMCRKWIETLALAICCESLTYVLCRLRQLPPYTMKNQSRRFRTIFHATCISSGARDKTQRPDKHRFFVVEFKCNCFELRQCWKRAHKRKTQ